MDIEVIVLGCGSSSGTPAIGCGCPTCTSPHPKDRRTRASSVVRVNGLNLLIDTSPDLRQQALREGITQIDAVLYTHPHADHLNGIDDLRAFCYAKRGVIPLFGNALMMENIRSRFGYTLLPPGTHWEMLRARRRATPFSLPHLPAPSARRAAAAASQPDLSARL